MALSPKFHQLVLENPDFQCSITAVVVDEAHNISEWGTEDFRPEFSRISSLLGHLPAGVPVIAASATVPPEVILDIQDKLGFGRDSECISVSNEKLNVALSVRTLQHPRNSFADLLFLFPSSGATAMDFIQTIIYHSPEYISYVSFEFYHRYISEDHKAIIEEAIANGTLRGTAATDALGMASFGMDFQGIKRVILWIEPCTFNSLVQKIGRCVRIFSELGEAIVFITKASLKRFFIEFNLDSVDGVNDSDGAPAGEEPEWEEPSYRDQTEEEEPRDDDDEVEDDEEGDFIGDFLEDHFEDNGKDAMNSSDNLVEPIPTRCKVTKRKKRNVDVFLGNCSKLPSLFPAPLGSRCCNNCEPLQFPVEAIRLTDPDQLRLPGRAQKSSPEVAEAVRSQLLVLREKLVADIYGPDQYMVTGKMILSDEIINVLAERARFVDSVEALKQCVYWHFAHEFGNDVVLVLADVLANFPDSAQKAQELQQHERALRALLKMEKRDLKNQISSISESCFVAVKNEMDGTQQVYPDYYNIIKTPISMANVKRGNVYESVAQYSSNWDLMFENAHEYNEDVSTIYNDTYILQHVFQNALEAATRIHGIILNDPE
ncbi:MAG: P-loop containing nucleoside triphosphate hydrolase protein [Lentinula lateritia]|nr:MAG: P-loop containing nucleoside triphosphate hydrolase protein [Lentinula lateritia]